MNFKCESCVNDPNKCGPTPDYSDCQQYVGEEEKMTMKKNEYLAMKLREYADRVEAGFVHRFRIEDAERYTSGGVNINNGKEVLISFEFFEKNTKNELE